MTRSTRSGPEGLQEPGATPLLPPAHESRALRVARSVTRDRLAAAVGVTPATVRSWETGRTSPRGRKRAAYARILARLEAGLPLEETAEVTPVSSIPADAPAGSPAQASAAPLAVQRLLIEAFTTPLGAAAPASPLPANGERPSSAEGAAASAGPAASPDGLRAGPSRDVVATTAPLPVLSAVHAAPPRRKQPRKPPSWAQEESADRATGPAAAATAPMTVERKRVRVPSWAREPVDDDRLGAGTAAPATPATPTDAFDALYERHAASLARQTYLLTGRPRLGRRAVERAFQLAWEQWPDVAVDQDPAGWVRAAAYEHALSPWHRLRPGGEPPTRPERDAALLHAMLSLPASYRRTLLLHDGVGLGLPETAAETEATTPAAANRLVHARAAVAELLPELRGLSPAARGAALRERFGALAAALPVTMTAARLVRADGERLTRRTTRAALGLTAVIAVATAFTVLTAEGPAQHRPRPQ
ncbi:helix-turn-helix domain-containing protein, partial [Streptomyces sp. NPDC057654]|uniref:helix-turn-helix domain-containing protein n=1 Tax=Streptomyces sp. NPDC057654 TaxID=3346196 RepID=UPI0036A016E8